MIDPKDVTPGFWYVANPGMVPPYTIVVVDSLGDVATLGNEETSSKLDPEFEFIGPVPAPSESACAGRTG